MNRVIRVLRALLPSELRDVAASDLERELHVRSAKYGPRTRDHLWLLGQYVGLVLRIWLGRAPSVAGATTTAAVVGVADSARSLARSPGMTLTAIVIVALGVSAPTAMYSIGDALTRGLPLVSPEELVTVSHASGRFNTIHRGLSAEEFNRVTLGVSALGEVVAHRRVMLDVGGEGRDPERVVGARVGHNLLEVLKESTVLGRGFTADDEGRAVALIV